MFGDGCYGGEPFFVARESKNPDAEEDDGYVVRYVHDEKKGESKFLVMDAKSPELEVEGWLVVVTVMGCSPELEVEGRRE